MATLRNTTWNITYQGSGSKGVLTLSDTTQGTYKPNGGSEGSIVWGEAWNGDTCALWVIFQDALQRDCIRIWGIQMTMAGGQGVSAYGNASNLNPQDTGYVNDNLLINPA